MKRVALLLLVASVGVASADDTTINYSHRGQLLASLRLGMGYRAIVPYEGTTFCGDTSTQTSTGNAAACIGRAPFSMDLELGYGVHPRIDLLLELRVGLESDFGATRAATDGPRAFHVSPGARFFWGETAKTKVFTTAQIVLDVAGYQGGNGVELGTDVGVRNLSGVWFDLAREYGFYLYAGPTASFARWFRFEMEAGFGFSGRYP